MLPPDVATIQALRSDIALQIARYAQRLRTSQLSAARRLGVPQPTLSMIVNGRTSHLSIELLIRIAVRAGLPITLQTGLAPQEAGAFISMGHTAPSRTQPSGLARQARESLQHFERRLSPTQRLEAFLEHNQLTAMLRQAGRVAEAARAGHAALKR